MSLVPAVTELLLAELLYLQYDQPNQPIYMYINSTGVTVGVLCLQGVCFYCLTMGVLTMVCTNLCVPKQMSCYPQKSGGKLGYEAEAFAIYDTMRYVKPPIFTVCVGNAFGESAMLLAAGEKVCIQGVVLCVLDIRTTWCKPCIVWHTTAHAPPISSHPPTTGQACVVAISNHHVEAANPAVYTNASQ